MHLEISTDLGGARVELDRPHGGARALLVMTHGAGGGVDTVDLLAIRDLAMKSGVVVARVLQPYRAAGRRTPGSAVQQDAAWLQVVAAVRARRGLRTLPMVLGGRSNGARVACRTASAAGAAGVLALAFPLHPPGRPEKSRLDELTGTGLPTLVVQGERDPFGMPPEGAGRTVLAVAGDHSLKRDPGAVARAAVEFVVGLLQP